ncbi:MAG: hypothetical protein ACSLEN_04600 [Candidatus Malihini olakiniferum]
MAKYHRDYSLGCAHKAFYQKSTLPSFRRGFDTVKLALSLMLSGYMVVPLNLLATDDTLAWIIPHSD